MSCRHTCNQGRNCTCGTYTPDDAYRWTDAAAALIVCAVIAAISIWSFA